jgi:hypothetical protein
MPSDRETISKTEAIEQVNRALRRAALLYHYFADTLIAELGKERGQRLILQAIGAYGAHIGRAAHERARQEGLDAIPENFQDDLPSMAWETEEVVVDDESRTRIHHCPLASVWQELGNPDHARLYCFVDQAKMTAFDPDHTYVHLKNVLDGDPLCELAVRPREAPKDHPFAR